MGHYGWLIASDMQQRAEALLRSHSPVSMKVHRGAFKNKNDPRAFDGKSSPLRLLKGLKRGRARTPWSIWPDVPSDLESRSQSEGGSFKEQLSNNRKYLKSDSRHRESPLTLTSMCASHQSRGRERWRRPVRGCVATLWMDALLLRVDGGFFLSVRPNSPVPQQSATWLPVTVHTLSKQA